MRHPSSLNRSSPFATQLPKGSDEFVEAFAKGLAVITAFADTRRPMSLADLSERTGLSRAGVRRLVRTLQTLGYADQQEGRFLLTPRTLRLGYAYLSGLPLWEVAQPVIDRLARDADETVGLSVLDVQEVVFVARAEVRGLLKRSVTVGSRLPVLATSMGRVLLAGLPEEKQASILAVSHLTAYTRQTITSSKRMREELRRVESQGYAVVTEELELGVCGIAAPIRDGSGSVIAAINLSTNLARHSEHQFVKRFRKRLIEAADEISQRVSAETSTQAGESDGGGVDAPDARPLRASESGRR